MPKPRDETAGGVVDSIFDSILNPKSYVKTYTSDYTMVTYRERVDPKWGKHKPKPAKENTDAKTE